MSLLRARILTVGVAMAVIAIAGGDIFDRRVFALVIAAAVPTIVALIVQPRALTVRLALTAVAAIGSTLTVVWISGGRPRDGLDAIFSGMQRLLTTEWPSPDQPDLIGAVALLLAVFTSLAVELAGRRRWHLIPLTPVVLAFVAVAALSAPSGARLDLLPPLAVLFVVFATLRPGSGVADQWTLLRRERRVIPLVLIASIAAAFVSVPLAFANRADPRRSDDASQTAALLDPIEATLALRSLDPPIDVHRVSSDATIPTRWRTAALVSYDGQRWAPALTLRPIGRRLGPDSADAITFEVQFLDDDVVLVPLPGPPIIVDARVTTDTERTVVRLMDRRSPDDPVVVTAALSPNDSGRFDGGIASRAIDERVSGLTEFATALGGGGTILEQLRSIEGAMRDDFVLAPNAPGGGLQQALIERFLRDTQRGTAEQFATAFVLLVRSLGVDARVATGYVTDASGTDGAITLSSADAAVWPEVRVLDRGWVAFDPVPLTEASDAAPPPEEPALQTPAAAQPPIAPPPEPSSDAQTDDQTIDDSPATALSSIGRWAFRIALTASALLAPVLLAMGVIVGLKRRHRRRRLAANTPAGRVTGAWGVATDRLVDAGLDIAPSSTNGDIATSGGAIAFSADRELRELSSLSSAVTFGTPSRVEVLAADAAAYLSHIESSMANDRTRAERLRWRLSLRSLRRPTRSPVR